MLKPLLRTTPLLSGNVKIGCSLTDYNKLSATEYESYVRYARLLPLSSILSQRKIEANLLSSTYEFDLQRYFKYYSDVFFKSVFDYNKIDIEYINESESQLSRDTDFEFGCKRVSYIKNDSQFAFYAPIYVESIDDLPDYFLINIQLKNDKYEIERKIKIRLNDPDSKYNYLYVYLSKYLKKLDSKVIYCLPNQKQAIYYGIDLLKGGFTKALDNLISRAFVNQNTINSFDSIITNGFERNRIVIKQILPLAFYFNVNDILSDDDKKKFSNCDLYITGFYYKNGEKLPFYDIDMDYKYFSEDPYILDQKNGLFNYIFSNRNILDIQYPSLNEANYLGYRYSNKITKTYNRWKLKYSSDERPYITNLSLGFSINQDSRYKYGQFPEKYKSINAICNYKNNMIFPIGNAITSKDSPYYNNYSLINNYYNIMNRYASSWYTLLDNTDDIYTKDIWKDVQDNKVYYNGILYDLTKIYEQYPKLVDNIDKFSVIVKLNFNKLSLEELKDVKKADTSIFRSLKYRNDKTCWVSDKIDDSLRVGDFNSLPSFYNVKDSFGNGNAELVFDKLYIKAKEGEDGDFIDLLSLGYDVYEINKYYKYSDIVTQFRKIGINIEELFSRIDIFSQLYFEGYEMLPIYRLSNVKHENDRDIVFENKENSEWILDNLYFSEHGNYYKNKYDRYTLSTLFNEYGDGKMLVPLYLKSKFMTEESLKEALYNIYGNSYTTYNSLFSSFNRYEYYPRVKDNLTSTTYASDLLMKKDKYIGENYGENIPSLKINTDRDILYVDSYNLVNVINKYNDKYNLNISLAVEEDGNHLIKQSFFAKILNLKHFLYYISDLYKDENLNVYDEEENHDFSKYNKNLKTLFDSLYIKKRIAINDTEVEDLYIRDQYIHISELYPKYMELTTDEKIRIVSGINSDSSAGQDIESPGYYEFKRLFPDLTPIAVIEDPGNMELTFEELQETYGVNIEPDQIGSGIYVQTGNPGTYTNDSFELVNIWNSVHLNFIVFWHCNAFNVWHDVYYDLDNRKIFRKISHAPYDDSGIYEIYLYDWHKSNEAINEYHKEDFYYIPIFYVIDGNLITKQEDKENIPNYNSSNRYYTNTSKSGEYISVSSRDKVTSSNDIHKLLSDYIKELHSDEDVKVLALINESTMSLIKDGEIINYSIEDVWLNAIRDTKEFDFSVIDKDSEEFISVLNRALELIKDSLVKLKKENRIYIYDYINGYKLYRNFSGINDFIPLGKEEKLSILRGESDIITYIIDDNGNFVKKGYNDDKYYKRMNQTMDNYDDYMKNIIQHFANDIVYHDDNNYFTMSTHYNQRYNLDSIVGIPDINGEYKSDFGFEICYKKNFYKLDEKLFELINLNGENEFPYKDLYIYKIYKPEDYPPVLRIYYTTDISLLSTTYDITNCLYPLFNDIFLQDKEYTVVYKEYNQGNITEAHLGNSDKTFYRYNNSDVMYMYDISDISYDTVFKSKDINNYNKTIYYCTNEYLAYLRSVGLSTNVYTVLPTFNLINSCYSYNECISDDLNIYNEFKVNSYVCSYDYTYSYMYKENVIETIRSKNGEFSAYNVVTTVDKIGTGYSKGYSTYGFIYIEANIDNTNVSFNIIDEEYKKKKYFTYINENDIYRENYSILDTFNLMVPFSNIDLQNSLYKCDSIISKPGKYNINTYYKQSEVNDEFGNYYAYNINHYNKAIDNFTLQRYFDDIVPYIKETTKLTNTYCLKFKDYKYGANIDYINDVFYNEDLNIYKYNKNRVYSHNNSYVLFEPTEYKYLNDNKFINLKEYFEITLPKKYTYNELLALETKEYTLDLFKNYILKDKLNTFEEHEILFLYNRYTIEYDSTCVGVNSFKTDKLYTLTYKFTLL